MNLEIRPAGAQDRDAVWAVLEPIFRAGDTYTIDPDIPREAALDYWLGASHGAYVACEGGEVLGTCYLKRNAGGGGAHVCNCGFATSPAAAGRGVARAMLDAMLERARAQGFRAMQFNFVVESNRRAVDIWERAGFSVVGRLPGAFVHPRLGEVDALVMYRHLCDPPETG